MEPASRIQEDPAAGPALEAPRMASSTVGKVGPFKAAGNVCQLELANLGRLVLRNFEQ